MRGVLAVIGILFASCAFAQLPEGARHYDPIGPASHAIHKVKGAHGHLRPFSPFIEREIVRATRDSVILSEDAPFLTIRPIADLQGGLSTFPTTGLMGVGSAGFTLDRIFGDRFYVHSNTQFAFQYFPDHLERITNATGMLNGLGVASELGEGRYTPYLTGAAGMRMGEHFNLEIGHGKNFWGNGYRSMVLSHAAAPYNYARLTTRFWKIKYENLWTRMQHRMAPRLNDIERDKFMTLHALSIDLGKRANLTVYEAIVWQAEDTLNQRGFDPAYLNPLIFYRPVEFGMGSADNALLGAEFSYDLFGKGQVYTQLFFDEILVSALRSGDGWWGNKFAIQVGGKAWDIFTEGLSLQTEFNLVRPFTFTHGSEIQAYGHRNQPLGHPLGTNFVEWLARGRYNSAVWEYTGTLVIAQFGENKEGLNLGGDVFTTYNGPWRILGNYLLQGERNTLVSFYGEAAKTLGWQELQAFGGLGLRYIKNSKYRGSDLMITVGLRTPIVRPYRDI
jgi:hypothetical protein